MAAAQIVGVCAAAASSGAVPLLQAMEHCHAQFNAHAPLVESTGRLLQPEEFRLGLGERRAGLCLWVCFARHTARCMRTAGAVPSWPQALLGTGRPHCTLLGCGLVFYRVLRCLPGRVGLEAGSVWQQCMPAAFGMWLLAPLLGCCWHRASDGGEQKAGLVCCMQQPARAPQKRQWFQEGLGFEGAWGCRRLAGRLLLGGCWIQRFRAACCSSLVLAGGCASPVSGWHAP